MQVSFKVFGELATVSGQSELTVEVADGTDVRGLLDAVDRQTGRSVSTSVLFDTGTVLPSLAVLLNGNNILLGSGLKSSLKPGDRVTVMPMISGGRI